MTTELAGKTCVITGATSGIGRVAAKALGRMGANLVVVGRNERAGASLVRRLRWQCPDSTFEFIRTDLSQRDEVRELASRIAQSFARVDVLINNAGARNDVYHETVDGIELTFAANHLGHFLLTHLLLDRLLQAPAARVITVGSNAHLYMPAYGDWYLKRADFDRRVAYGKSKLANIMFAFELARRLRDTRVTSNAVDPGLVATHFARNNGLEAWLRHLVSHALRRQLISSRKGAETLVYLAAAPEVAGVTGKYFYRTHEVDSSPDSHDREQARRLWQISLQLTGVDHTLHATS